MPHFQQLWAIVCSLSSNSSSKHVCSFVCFSSESQSAQFCKAAEEGLEDEEEIEQRENPALRFHAHDEDLRKAER